MIEGQHLHSVLVASPKASHVASPKAWHQTSELDRTYQSSNKKLVTAVIHP